MDTIIFLCFIYFRTNFVHQKQQQESKKMNCHKSTSGMEMRIHLL